METVIAKIFEFLPPIMAVMAFVIWMLFRLIRTMINNNQNMTRSLDAHTATLTRMITLLEVMTGGRDRNV